MRRTRKVPPAPAILMAFVSLSLPACDRVRADAKEGGAAGHEKIVLTTPQVRDVTVSDPFVCQIHSQRHIAVRALQAGYLEPISIREGQQVDEGEVLFKILPTLYQARLDAELAEAQLAQIEFANSQKLHADKVVSAQEVALQQARLDKAKAKAKLAAAELNFTVVRAPFRGIVDRLHEQQGSLVKEGDALTTLSDNSTMWVYFNLPESQYLEYMAGRGPGQAVELMLANGSKFPYPGRINTVEAQFHSETGNISFRADFPNPQGLLRHGQTGNVLVPRILKDALVIPERATFDVLDKKYVFVVGPDRVARQREITVELEKDDFLVVKDGLDHGDRFVLDGVQSVRDGDSLGPEPAPRAPAPVPAPAAPAASKKGKAK